MKIRIRLKELLAEIDERQRAGKQRSRDKMRGAGARRHGPPASMFARITRKTREWGDEIHTPTLHRLYYNTVKQPHLGTLGTLCRWLHEEGGIAPDRLPHELFGQTSLWSALGQTAEVAIYQGLHHAEQPDTPVTDWVSLRDASLTNALVRLLSDRARVGFDLPRIDICNVPFVPLDEREGVAKRYREQVQERHDERTCVFVGGGIINLYVECAMANLLRLGGPCLPFQSLDGGQRPPIYLQFQKSYHGDALSCFGGVAPPPGHHQYEGPGAYFLTKNEGYKCCPFEPWKKDAGVVVIHRDPQQHILEMLVFGFSGASTEALAATFDNDAEKLWPPFEFEESGREVGIYVVEFESRLDANKSGPGAITWDAKIHEVEKDVLKTCLRAG